MNKHGAVYRALKFIEDHYGIRGRQSDLDIFYPTDEPESPQVSPLQQIESRPHSVNVKNEHQKPKKANLMKDITHSPIIIAEDAPNSLSSSKSVANCFSSGIEDEPKPKKAIRLLKDITHSPIIIAEDAPNSLSSSKSVANCFSSEIEDGSENGPKPKKARLLKDPHSPNIIQAECPSNVLSPIKSVDNCFPREVQDGKKAKLVENNIAKNELARKSRDRRAQSAHQSTRDPRLRKSLPENSNGSSVLAPIPSAEGALLKLLEWKGEWLIKEQCPSFFKNLLVSLSPVSTSFDSATTYGLTYHALHLFSLWCSMKRIFATNPPEFRAKLNKSQEKKGLFWKNVCRALLTDASQRPVHESLVLVTYAAADGQKQRVFASVSLVQVCRNRPEDVEISFVTKHPLSAPAGSPLSIQNLSPVRVFLQQYCALASADRPSPLRQVAVSPAAHRDRIGAVSSPSADAFSARSDELVAEIGRRVRDPANLVTLVEPPAARSKILLFKLVSELLPGDLRVVVCARDEREMRDVARMLCFGTQAVLAVKESEVRLDPDGGSDGLSGFLLRNRARALGQKEERVVQESRVVVTVLSRIYLAGLREFPPRTLCVVHDAHLQPEAHTALAVQLKPERLVLFGNHEAQMEVDHPYLRQLGYPKTLFHRLWDASKNPRQ